MSFYSELLGHTEATILRDKMLSEKLLDEGAGEFVFHEFERCRLILHDFIVSTSTREGYALKYLRSSSGIREAMSIAPRRKCV